MLPRVDRFKTLMKKEELDALIVFSSEDVYYASGYSALEPQKTLCSVVLTSEGESTLLVPKSDVGFIGEDCHVKDRRTYGKYYVETPLNLTKEYEDSVEGFVDICKELRLKTKKIGLGGFGLIGMGGKDWEELSVPSFSQRLEHKLPEARFVSAAGVFRELRQLKTEEEVKSISKAVSASEKALMKAYATVRENMSELELASEFKTGLAKENAECVFIEMGAGTRSALPTHPSSHRIKKGDMVHFDIGVKCAGYCSDIARNAVLGKPSDKQLKVHKALQEAQRKAVEAIKPGARLCDVFEIGQNEVRKHGFPQYYRHHIGHGIGIEPHEFPSINPKNTDTLRTGMVVTIEIPYYIADVGGFNIEDVIQVTDDGHELISTFGRQLFELPL